jgi:hypothetical protein
MVQLGVNPFSQDELQMTLLAGVNKLTQGLQWVAQITQKYHLAKITSF